MSTVTIEEAQANLPEIIDKLEPGEQLTITENDQPIAKLTRSPCTSWPCQPRSARNKSHWTAEDFDAPLEDFNSTLAIKLPREGHGSTDLEPLEAIASTLLR
jgi:antitoxin (DNA-binding transcriptional repressor) of toxin-antitoxin stability system